MKKFIKSIFLYILRNEINRLNNKIFLLESELKKYQKFSFFISILSLNSSKFLKLYNKNSDSKFSSLCDKHGSDKSSISKVRMLPWEAHSYELIYENMFNRNDKLNIFELGIGTNNPNIKSNMTKNGKPGASLKVFSEYYKNAMIYGGDIDKNILFNTKRIKTFYVDQTNKQSILELWSNFTKKSFDLIIDDGLHELNASKSFFLNSVQYLKPGGFYVIEDVINSELKKYNNFYSKFKNFDMEVIMFMNQKKIYDDSIIILRKLF